MKANIKVIVNQVEDHVLAQRLRAVPHQLHKGKTFISGSRAYTVEEISTYCKGLVNDEVFVEIIYNLSSSYSPIY